MYRRKEKDLTKSGFLTRLIGILLLIEISEIDIKIIKSRMNTSHVIKLTGHAHISSVLFVKRNHLTK